MAAFNKFNALTADLAAAKHNFTSNVFKAMLANAAPVATNSVKADLTEIASGNGYTAGGGTVAITSANQSAGTLSVVMGADVVITASGGAVGPFRYLAVYNDTTVNKPLVSWYDYGSAITLQAGESFTFKCNGVNLFTMV